MQAALHHLGSVHLQQVSSCEPTPQVGPPCRSTWVPATSLPHYCAVPSLSSTNGSHLPPVYRGLQAQRVTPLTSGTSMPWIKEHPFPSQSLATVSLYPLFSCPSPHYRLKKLRFRDQQSSVQGPRCQGQNQIPALGRASPMQRPFPSTQLSGKEMSLLEGLGFTSLSH